MRPYNNGPYRVFCNERALDRKAGLELVIVV